MSTIRFLTSAVIGCALLVSCSEAKFYGTSPARAKTADEQAKPNDPTKTPDTSKNPDGSDNPPMATPGSDEPSETPPGTTEDPNPATPVAAPDPTPPGTGSTDTPTTDNPSTPDMPANPNNPGSGSDTPPAPPSNPPAQPVCQDTEHATGAHVAFLIDNSNSNAATDCPSPVKVGTFQGSDLYECKTQTNREKAVMAAYDLLAAIGAKEPASALAQSTVALASFPTRADFMSGYQKETAGMLEASGTGRETLGSALGFARKPYGQTPYGGAMSAANELFSGLADDGKARVAVLVTDGEPTDRNPSAVSAQADALRAQGIAVFTVFYSAQGTRAQRAATHKAMMQKIDDATVTNTGKHWYDQGYVSLDTYVTALIGNGTSQKSLAATISKEVVELSNSNELRAALESIVKKTIVCE